MGETLDEGLAGRLADLARVLAVHSAKRSANQLTTALRNNNPPIVARIRDERVLFDLRTVADEEIAEIADALRRIAT